MTGVFPITFLKEIFAFPISNHNTVDSRNLIPAYQPILNTPIINKYCLPLSEKRQELSKSDLNEYMCFCMKMSTGSKNYLETTYNSLKWMKSTNDQLLNTFVETFLDISKYLQIEFSKQDQIIQFLTGETKNTPIVSDSQLSDFIIKNLELSVDRFYSKYVIFLKNHLLLKYKENFKKLKKLNIPRLLNSELKFINCHNEYSYKDGDFKTISDAIKSVNRRMVGLFNSMLIIAS